MAAAPLLEGKVVLDVGCGAGLLSLMAAEVRAAGR
jgi:cyclopropane fatty-acyl-phospholipid synthase-like methyltransferase